MTYGNKAQPNPFHTDTEGTEQSVRIREVSVLEWSLSDSITVKSVKKLKSDPKVSFL